MQNVKMGVKWALLKFQKNKAADEITHTPMRALTLAAVTARIFYLIVIDAPETENSGWLSVLMGACLSLPAILGAYFLMKKNGASVQSGIRSAVGETGLRILSLFLSLALTYETAALFTILTASGAYATLYDMHKLLLLVPTSLAVIYACCKGGNGIGGAAEVLLRVYLILYAVIIILENDTMNASNLFPILGPGVHTLLKSALSAMMYFCLIPVSYMIETGYTVNGRNRQKRIQSKSILYVFGLCILLSVFVTVVHSLMYPSLSPVFESRSDGMDLMLSNGRSNRTVQLPILIIWFSSLAVSAGYMLYMAGRLMNTALREEGKKCMVLLGLIAMVIALFRCSGQSETLYFSSGIAPFLGTAFVILPAIGLIRAKKRS